MLTDKVMVITGAGGGIGTETALACARDGAKLVLVDRESQSLDRLAERLIDDGADRGRFSCETADVSRGPDVESYFQKALERFGQVHILFNNAGIEGDLATIVEAEEADLDRVLAVNVKGLWLNLKYGIRAIRRTREGGCIVNSGSVASLIGGAGYGAYVASKHAVLGLTRTAALECAKDDIRVLCICPGPVDTRMQRAIDASIAAVDPNARGIKANVPMARYASPSEIASLVRFLVSDEASYMTGAAIPIDGGLTAW